MMHVVLRHQQQHLTVDLQVEAGQQQVTIDGATYVVETQQIDAQTLSLVVDGQRYCVGLVHRGTERLVAVNGEVYAFVPESGGGSAHTVPNVAAPEIVAPMPGKVLQVPVHPGDHVVPGDTLLILEAMKMETRLTAEAAAHVAEVRVAAGDMVNGGQVLVVLAYDES